MATDTLVGMLRCSAFCISFCFLLRVLKIHRNYKFFLICLEVVGIVCIFVSYPSFRYGQVEARGGIYMMLAISWVRSPPEWRIILFLSLCNFLRCRQGHKNSSNHNILGVTVIRPQAVCNHVEYVDTQKYRDPVSGARIRNKVWGLIK